MEGIGTEGGWTEAAAQSGSHFDPIASSSGRHVRSVGSLCFDTAT